LEFGILGPLAAWDEGRELTLGGAKQRALLAVLLLRANEDVATARLVDELWGEQPPATAAKAVQVYVSQLRKLLGPSVVETRPTGYRLAVARDALDRERFEDLLERGRELVAEGAEVEAVDVLRQALALWRGPPLADFAYEAFAQNEIGRLEGLRLAALELRLQADLALGRAAEVVGELQGLVHDHPLRETLRRLLMLALYRSGRQADALTVYQEGRAALVEELGLDPSPALQQLERQILQHDPSLELPAATPRAPERALEPDSPVPTRTVPEGLPTGTVTLLFADIEGSTGLLTVLGDGFAEMRARVRELVRASSARGSEVDWAGDGVFLAFARARDAVAAAANLQRTLDSEPWPQALPVRMRIGIHTGEPQLGEEGYVGLDVHIAARICSVAHGGQVVVSRATRDLVGEGLGLELDFRPLGDHRLKGVATPQALFQVIGDGLDDAFPPLATLRGATLPALHHRLVGRSRDLASAQVLLARPDVRLITITGPGGTGKSRLALEAAGAAAVERPVHLVGLASISDPALVPAAIARALGLQESPGQTLPDVFASALAGTRALLVLDNMEHLLPAAADVATLLSLVADLDVLVTSRTPLRLSGEHVVPLTPLPIEDATTLFFELAASHGVPLGVESVVPVQAICKRLDSLPLAIELVAARLVLLPPADLLAALGDGLALEMEGPVDLPARQRTLHATLEWSYSLLTPRQRELHGLLAVFAGGATLEDTRAVAGAPEGFLTDLEALVAGSLLRREAGDGGVRLSMLETVREDAAARLADAGMLDEARHRHADRFVAVAGLAEEGLAGFEQTGWLERLEQELDNLRVALDWCLANGRVAEALRAVSALERFWPAHGHVGEARRLLERGIAEAADVSDEVRARALWTAARAAMLQSDYHAAVPALEESLTVFRRLGDDRHAVFALCELARALSSQDELERAHQAGEDALSLAERAGDTRAASAALDTLAMVADYRGQHLQALALSERSLELRRSLGDAILVMGSTNTLGLAAMRAGDLDAAQQAFTECLDLARGMGEKVLEAAALCALGEIALGRDLPELAAGRLGEALLLYREIGDERAVAECLHGLGGVAAALERPRDAMRLWGAADALREQSGAGLTPEEKDIDRRFGHPVAADGEAAALEDARHEGRSLSAEALDDLIRYLTEVSIPPNIGAT